MPKCSVCGIEAERIYDGKCAYCLGQETEKEEEERDWAENDPSGTEMPGKYIDEHFCEIARNLRIPLPDLESEGYVAQAAGYDVRSRAWKMDGQRLMRLVKQYREEIKAGEIDYGSAKAFLERTKPNYGKKLLQRVGSACVWRWVPDF